jgi:mono/diheme cytochrome c family protein
MLLVALMTLALVGCEGLAGEPRVVATLPPQTIEMPPQAPDLALGARVYAENCVRCHGESGRGDGVFVQTGQVTNVADFTQPGTRAGETPVDYFNIITEGRIQTLMPPWRDSLNANERWAVALYVYMLPYNNAAMLTAGEQVWQTECAQCHAADGSGTGEVPALPLLLQRSNDALLSLLIGTDGDGIHAYNETLSPEARASVIGYTRSLQLANPGQAPVAIAQAATPTSAGAAAAPADQATAAPDAQPTAAATQPAAATGSIIGQIMNGTAGSSAPGSLPLTLHVVDSQFSEETFETTADAAGAYRFTDIPFRGDRQYVITADYRGVVFMSDIVPLDPAAAEHSLPLTVYEPGADASAIHIDRMMMQVSANHGQLAISQLVSFTNTSDRIYLESQADGGRSVTVNVPAGFQYADFMGGGYQVSADGTQVSDNVPIIPGQPTVMHLTYIAPYPGSVSVSVAQTWAYPISGPVQLILGSAGLDVMTDALVEGEPLVTSSGTTRNFTGSLNLPAGSSLRFSVSGTPVEAAANAAASQPVNSLAYVLIGGGVLALLLALVLYVRERRHLYPAAALAAPAQPEVNALIKRIASLDVQHREGKLDDRRYERQRAELKAQLNALMKANRP